MKNNSDVSFIRQIKRTFILIILIPVLLLGSFIFYSSYHYIQQQKKTEVNNIVEQNVLDLNNRMNQCENSLRYIAGNYSLQQFLQMDEKSYQELNNAESILGPLLYNTLLSNQYYKKLKIYANKNYHIMNDLVDNSNEVEQSSWYKTTMTTSDICWWYIDGNYFISQRIQNAYPEKIIGVVLVELKEDVISSSFNFFENYPIRIQLMQQNENICSYGKKGIDSSIGYDSKEEMECSGWSISYEVSKSFFTEGMLTHFLVPMLVMCVVLLLTWLLFHIQSKGLVKDLDYLVEEVNQVETGNLDVVFKPAKITEINVLAISIERMLEKIKKLIRQVYTKEIERQDLELNLLQSKISPHFLYNNLSAINWIAIDNHQDKIYEITTEMATFYRSALNQGKNVDKLAVEMANIKAYINLQLISHENSFDVEYHIDEELLNQDIPIFILQPLVENAIEHGIDELREGRGKLLIQVLTIDRNIELAVLDNGTELYHEIGNQMLKVEAYGYGMGNVHRRIQLFYGKEYGLTIMASEKGTKSTICLKRDGLRKNYVKETS